MKHLFSILLLIISTCINAQYFTKLSCKTGETFSRQSATPKIPEESVHEMKRGLSFTIEPTIITFGNKHQYDFSTDISYIQKGGFNHVFYHSYDDYGQLLSTGTGSYPITINYISISPLFKTNFWKILFMKAGPRLDVFTSFKQRKMVVPSVDPKTNKDFEPLTYGITYGLGVCLGKNRVKFISELVGQNDFSNSSYSKLTGQTFKNNCYLLNFGVTIMLKNQ